MNQTETKGARAFHGTDLQFHGHDAIPFGIGGYQQYGIRFGRYSCNRHETLNQEVFFASLILHMTFKRYGRQSGASQAHAALIVLPKLFTDGEGWRSFSIPQPDVNNFGARANHDL